MIIQHLDFSIWRAFMNSHNLSCHVIVSFIYLNLVIIKFILTCAYISLYHIILMFGNLEKSYRSTSYLALVTLSFVIVIIANRLL
jgi:hypothetical protein